jgi:phosphoglycerol transferase MdoB-like AlkP superfamily enzyme
MTNYDLISGLFDAAFYVVPILVGAVLWFFGWLRRPEGHTMKWTGVVLVVLFGLPAVNRLIFYVRTDDRFAIDPDDAVVVAVYVGAGVALAIVIPLAIHVGKRIGNASVGRGGSSASRPVERKEVAK